MQTLRYVGTSIYRGLDAAAGRIVVAAPGDEVRVSEEKARQLLRDFPDQWQRVEALRRTRRPARRRMSHPRRNK